MAETIHTGSFCGSFKKELNLNKTIGRSTSTLRMVCAVVFITFTFCYLYFYQADVLAATQYVLSGGKTRYNRLIGAILITAILYLIHISVSSLSHIKGRFFALNYFPSFLFLSVFGNVNIYNSSHPLSVAWMWIAPTLLLLYGAAVHFIRQLQQYEPKALSESLFSHTVWINVLALLVMSIAVELTAIENDVLHYRMRIEALLKEGKYTSALQIGEKSNATDESLVMLRAFALAHEKALGERLFEYPLTGGAKALIPDKNSSCIIFPEIQIRRFASTNAADDYRLCAYLMDKDLESFVKSVGKCYDLSSKTLPKHYREALTLYTHRHSNPIISYHNNVMDADYEDMMNMERKEHNLIKRKNAVKDGYQNTYWYYYFYVKE